MNGKTHKLGGLCTGIVVSSMLLNPPYELSKLFLVGAMTSASVIGSLLPDIDHQGSTMGKKHKFISSIVHNLFGHRGLTHAPLMHILIFIAFLFLGNGLTGYLSLIYISFVGGLFIGGLSHLFLDIITVEGIPILYPFMKRKFRIMRLTASKKKNKNNKTEEIVNFIMIAITVIIVKVILF